MRYIKGRGIVFIGLAVFVIVFGAGCDPSNTAAQTAVDQVADELIEEGKTLFAPTETPVPPTETPVPPTDTPVPTPTEVKVGMLDEEGDCEVVGGSIGEDGCQVDLASFEAFPCYADGMVGFQVEFNAIPDVNTWDVCFTINSDNDPDTGFNNDPALGIDWVYCWSNETQEIFFNRFGPGGDFLNVVQVSDPLSYVVTGPDGNVLTSPFTMTFPPPDVPDLVLNSPFEVYAEGHFYNTSGDWVWDRGGPIEVPSCPGQ